MKEVLFVVVGCYDNDEIERGVCTSIESVKTYVRELVNDGDVNEIFIANGQQSHRGNIVDGFGICTISQEDIEDEDSLEEILNDL